MSQKIMIEVRDRKELDEALSLTPDFIMLDNMSTAELRHSRFPEVTQRASHARGVHQLYKAPDRPAGLARPARNLDREPSRAEYVQIAAVAVSGFHLPKGMTLRVPRGAAGWTANRRRGPRK